MNRKIFCNKKVFLKKRRVLAIVWEAQLQIKQLNLPIVVSFKKLKGGEDVLIIVDLLLVQK